MAELRSLTLEYVDFVAKNMRHEDSLEVFRSTGKSAPEVLIKSIDISEYTGCIVIDEEPACIYGVSNRGDFGVPWSMSTYVVDHHPKEFYEASKAGIDLIKRRYDVLFNYVDATYVRAIRWIKRLGFSVGEPEPFGALGLPFSPFWWRKHV